MTTESKAFKSELVNKRGDKIIVESPVVIFDQDDNKIVFSPTLELYGYGKTLRQAKSSLNTNLEEFINYTMNKGTFALELKRLGWQFKKRKRQYVVPSFSEMLRKNEKLIKILDNENATIGREEFSLPIA